ncbi:MAG: hypothetical protein ACTSPY_06705 [Candidatus Helarchaeota archaeon]
MEYEYYTLVGIHHLAVANAFIWLCRTNPEINIKKITFICSRDELKFNTKGSVGVEKEVITSIKEQWDELKLNGTIPKFNNEIITISEMDILYSVNIIGDSLLSVSSDQNIILDCTGGRKAMTIAASLAGIYLMAKYNRNISISYYWLKQYSKETMSKKASELGLDEAIIKIFTPNEIEKALGEIKFE